jgi:predicted DNA-binding transcriptional regulator AlpA
MNAFTDALDIERKAFSIPEWCKARRISRSHYYALRQKGLTPKELRLGGRVIITEESDAAWQKRMEEECKR